MLKNILSFIYDRSLRPRLPRRIAVYNGVAAPSKYKLLDFGYEPARQDYEQPLCRGIRNRVLENDSVTVIGGGKGVSAVLAAQRSYPNGSVDVFEASQQQCEIIQATCSYYPSGDRVTIHHAGIGSINNAYGEVGDPDTIEPSALPSSDVLVVDAEGAEADILPELGISPREIIVESHGCFGSPTESVKNDLEQNGYEVTLIGYESKKEDVAVLLGTN